MAEKDRLLSLKERLSKSEDETVRLKEAIVKEEKRLREKEKRENEKWWNEFSKKAEKLLVSTVGTDYKARMNQDTLLEIVRQGVSTLPAEKEENNSDICEHTGEADAT